MDKANTWEEWGILPRFTKAKQKKRKIDLLQYTNKICTKMVQNLSIEWGFIYFNIREE